VTGIVTRTVALGALVALAAAACGDDGAGPTDTAEADTASPEVADTDPVEVEDDAVGEVAEEIADASDTGDAEPEVVDVGDVALGEVVIDRNCEFDPRLTNHRATDRRCGACRSALGALRVRAELLWWGSYSEPVSASEACVLFPNRACKASVVEAEAVLCEDTAEGEAKVVWSDLAVAIVGEGDEAQQFEVRGPSYGIRLSEVWRASPAALLPTAEAFEPASWRVGAPAEQVPASVAASPREHDCPVKRFTIQGRRGDIGPCQAAVALLGKVP